MEIQVSFEGLKEFEAALNRTRNPRRIIASAAKEIANHTKRAASVMIREVYNIDAGTIKKGAKVYASGDMEYTYQQHNPEVSLMRYKPQPNRIMHGKKGSPDITIEVVKGQRRTASPGRAFIEVGNGTRGVFDRIGGGHRTPKMRFLKGIGPAQELLSRRMGDRVPNDSGEFFLRRLGSKIMASLMGGATGLNSDE